jgi:hypothetical protein
MIRPVVRVVLRRCSVGAAAGRLLGVAIPVVILAACWHSSGGEEPRFEARRWLLGNRNPSALASSRFETTAAALRFVDRLVAAGAESVFVTGVSSEPWRVKAQGGPYADALVIVLPEDNARREDLFRLINREVVKAGMPVQYDEGQEDMLLWWN